MYCDKCGTENPDTAVFCKECGAPVQKRTEDRIDFKLIAAVGAFLALLLIVVAVVL